MADGTHTWQAVTARSDQLLDALKFECIVSGLLGTTAQDVSFEAIRSCLQAKSLFLQRDSPQAAPTGRRHHKPKPAQDGHPVEHSLAPPACRDAVLPVDNADDHLKALQRNTIRALFFVANAHQRAARTHDHAASLRLGDVEAHRRAAERHRAAEGDAIRRRWAYLMRATLNLISDDGTQPLVVNDVP